MQSRLIGTMRPFSGKVIDEYGLPTDNTEGELAGLLTRGACDVEAYDGTEIEYTPEEESKMRAWLDDRIAAIRRANLKADDDPIAAAGLLGLDDTCSKIKAIYRKPTPLRKAIKLMIDLGYSSRHIAATLSKEHSKGLKAAHIERLRKRWANAS